MSQWSIVGLVSAYAVVILLLLNVLCFTRWMWWVKLACAVVVATLLLVSYRSVPQLLGWPATSGLPSRFNLVGMQIVEPDKSGANKGSIYLWVTDLVEGGGRRIPRAFVLPFTAELQMKIVAAGTKLNKRLPQIGEIVQDGGGEPGAGAHLHGGLRNLHIEFLDMPDPLFPEK